MNYTSNMLRGFGTSGHVSEIHYRAALKINDAIKTHGLLMADRTRTKAEKAPMLAQLQQKLAQEAARDVKAMLNNLEARDAAIEKQKADILASMSLADALALTNAMKGLTASEMVAATRENRELALAMAIVPSSLSGFNKEQAIDTLIDAHFPNFKAAIDEMAGDVSAYNSLSRNVDNVVRELGNSVDFKALESRFDPSKLEVAPPPATMAEQNAELARLEKASGIEPTVNV